MGGLGQHVPLLSDPAVQLVHFGKVREKSMLRIKTESPDRF
jgi:hypothetical protein